MFQPLPFILNRLLLNIFINMVYTKSLQNLVKQNKLNIKYINE